jgi:hypothetical protein
MNKRSCTAAQYSFITDLVNQIFAIQNDPAVLNFLTGQDSMTMKQASSRIKLLREILDNQQNSK